jgi:hypothetical protein
MGKSLSIGAKNALAPQDSNAISSTNSKIPRYFFILLFGEELIFLIRFCDVAGIVWGALSTVFAGRFMISFILWMDFSPK